MNELQVFDLLVEYWDQIIEPLDNLRDAYRLVKGVMELSAEIEGSTSVPAVRLAATGDGHIGGLM